MSSLLTFSNNNNTALDLKEHFSYFNVVCKKRLELNPFVFWYFKMVC